MCLSHVKKYMLFKKVHVIFIKYIREISFNLIHSGKKRRESVPDFGPCKQALLLAQFSNNIVKKGKENTLRTDRKVMIQMSSVLKDCPLGIDGDEVH